MNNTFEISETLELKKRLIQKLIQIIGGSESDYEHLSIEEIEAQLEIYKEELEAPTIPNTENTKSEIRSSKEENTKSEIRSSNEENAKSEIRSSNEENAKSEIRSSKEENTKSEIRSSKEENTKSEIRSPNEENAKSEIRSSNEENTKLETLNSNDEDFIVGLEEGENLEQENKDLKDLIIFEPSPKELETIEGEVIETKEDLAIEHFEKPEVIEGKIEPIEESDSKENKPSVVIPFKSESPQKSSYSHLGGALDKVITPRIPATLMPEPKSIVKNLPKEEGSLAPISKDSDYLTIPNFSTKPIDDHPEVYYPKQFKPEEIKKDKPKNAAEDKKHNKEDLKDEVLKQGAGASVPGQTQKPMAPAPSATPVGLTPNTILPKDDYSKDIFIFYLVLIVFIGAVIFVLINFWPEIKEFITNLI